MKTIAVINQKGGVGKSTTALALLAGLQGRGYKVLGLDLDPQSNFTYTAKADSSAPGSFELLAKTASAAACIQSTYTGDVISASPRLTGADITFTRAGKEHLLAEALQPVSDLYDYCIIDTPPALSTLTLNALTTSNYIVIPALADAYSLQGIGQLKDTLDVIKAYTNPGLQIAGILLTKYTQRTTLNREVAELLEQLAEHLQTSVFNTTIRESVAIREAQITQQNPFIYAPKAKAIIDYNAFINELLERVKERK